MGKEGICSCKHAYLIIAHKDDHTFRTLLHLLDDVRNDLFIHMDIKNRAYCSSEIKDLIKYSTVYHTSKRIDVRWGGYSQIQAELIVLREAASHGHYRYYHLLSGQDLPIKSQDYIHDFFERHDGKEFVQFESDTMLFPERVDRYWFFQEMIGRKQTLPALFLRKLARVFCIAQPWLGYKRNKNIIFQKGANWFSITDDLANFVLEKEDWIQKTFKFTQCADEIFLHTIVHNSDYKNRLYHPKYDCDRHGSMRLIDWKRGRPYIWRATDKQELQGSDLLFARKFDCEIDKEIVDFISDYLNCQCQ